MSNTETKSNNTQQNTKTSNDSCKVKFTLVYLIKLLSQCEQHLCDIYKFIRNQIESKRIVKKRKLFV